jgi:Glycosyl transferase family 90
VFPEDSKITCTFVFWIFFSVPITTSCDINYRNALLKSLFSGVQTPLERLDSKYERCMSHDASIIEAVTSGFMAPSELLDLDLAQLMRTGWPLVTLAVSLRLVELTRNGIFDFLTAMKILVNQTSTDPCLKRTAIVSIALSKLPVINEDLYGLIDLIQIDIDQVRNEYEWHQCPSFIEGMVYLEAQLYYAKVDANEFYQAVKTNPEVTGKESRFEGADFFYLLRDGRSFLSYWIQRVVNQSDIEMAFRPISDLKLIKITKLGNTLEFVIPLDGFFKGSMDRGELQCLRYFLTTVLRKSSFSSDFTLILNQSDLPLVRLVENSPPFYDLSSSSRNSSISPVPLFSLAGKEDFGDLVFPNVCRPRFENLRLAKGAVNTWEEKISKLFYRATDRGAINWMTDQNTQDFSRLKSVRREFVEYLEKYPDLSDVALLEDDLLDADLVNSNPKFVKFEDSQKFKYLLDLPGNGYSGSLKSKLSSSSVVFMLDKLQVYEHFYFGLKPWVHFIPILNPQDALKKVQWAAEHDQEVQKIVKNANEFMESFDFLSECYLWFQLVKYSKAIKFDPELRTGPGNSFLFEIPAEENSSFKEKCNQFYYA